jgi:hypothetical protein
MQGFEILTVEKLEKMAIGLEVSLQWKGLRQMTQGFNG